MTTLTTRTVEVPGATLTYDVREPDAPSDHRPLFIFGSPMGASGFEELVAHFTDRTVLTYDPRGAERSKLAADGTVTGELHGEDLHAVVVAAGVGPVDAFGSSGGGAFGLHWVARYPDDVRTFVSHEPPLGTLLEDRDVIDRVGADIVETYRREGFGAGMAKFIQMVMHQGLYTQEYLDRPAPDPAQFGLPTEDDGSRDDPLLGRNMAIPPFVPDLDALRASPVRVLPAVGAESGAGMPRRGGEKLAELLGAEPVEFPGDHGGFASSEWSPGSDPAAFAARLRELL